MSLSVPVQVLQCPFPSTVWHSKVELVTITLTHCKIFVPPKWVFLTNIYTHELVHL